MFNNKFINEKESIEDISVNLNKGSKKILVIDDEEDIALFIKIALSKAGYSVTTTTDSLKAMEIFENEPFNMVITDIHMPEVNGLEILDRVTTFVPETKVIIVSAETSSRTIDSAIHNGAFRYLLKPVSVENLLKAVRTALEVKEVSQLVKKARKL